MPCQIVHRVTEDVNTSENMHNNSTNSGTSIEGSSLVTDSNSSPSGHLNAPQQTTQEGQTCPRHIKRRGEQLSNPTWISQSTMPAHQVSVYPMMNSKKPRLETNQLRFYDPELEASSSKQYLSQNQTQNPQSFHFQPLCPQQLPGDAQKQLATIAAVRGGIFVSRLMSYIYHQRLRPPDNEIGYWRQFVQEFYSPYAKKKWCFCKYPNVDRLSRGVFSNAAMRDISGSKARKELVATFEVLPRLKKIYFDSGVIDELLHLDCACEKILPSGFIMCSFGKAVQETIYKDFRIVHEGQLHITFTQELKIIFWEFCIQRHEELISPRLVAAQINELVENATRCQNDIEAKETDGNTTQDLLSNCNRLAAAGQELARKLELPQVNGLGFSKHVFRSLQIYEVVNLMDDLITCSHGSNLGPRETLNRYAKEVANSKLKMRQHMEERAQMHYQTQAPPGYNFQVANSIYGENPIFSSTQNSQKNLINANYFQELDMNQGPYKNVLCSSESQKDPALEQRMLNELLWMMRSEGAKGPRATRPKAQFIYDPNIEGAQLAPGGLRPRG